MICYPAVNTHTVSVSKDSGFYTEDQDDEDPVIEKGMKLFQLFV